jgi:hypothetical protein
MHGWRLRYSPCSQLRIYRSHVDSYEINQLPASAVPWPPTLVEHSMPQINVDQRGKISSLGYIYVVR